MNNEVSLSKLVLYVVIAKMSLTTLKSIKPDIDMMICVLASKFGIGRHILYMKLNVQAENHTKICSLVEDCGLHWQHNVEKISNE